MIMDGKHLAHGQPSTLVPKPLKFTPLRILIDVGWNLRICIFAKQRNSYFQGNVGYHAVTKTKSSIKSSYFYYTVFIIINTIIIVGNSFLLNQQVYLY